jgi:hypothetical protein
MAAGYGLRVSFQMDMGVFRSVLSRVETWGLIGSLMSTLSGRYQKTKSSIICAEFVIASIRSTWNLLRGRRIYCAVLLLDRLTGRLIVNVDIHWKALTFISKATFVHAVLVSRFTSKHFGKMFLQMKADCLRIVKLMRNGREYIGLEKRAEKLCLGVGLDGKRTRRIAHKGTLMKARIYMSRQRASANVVHVLVRRIVVPISNAVIMSNRNNSVAI